MNVKKSNLNKYKNRWLVYFDILGFKNIVNDKNVFSILELYERALSNTKNHKIFTKCINYAYFSDTFIFYSENDSEKEFTWIQSVAKNMIRKSLENRIPLRGALTMGEFYADKNQQVYFGNGIIDAYEEAERQDWIGLIITQASEKSISTFGLNPTRFKFKKWMIPIKGKSKPTRILRYAYNFDSNINLDKKLGILENMKRESSDRKKYSNTIKFLKKT